MTVYEQKFLTAWLLCPSPPPGGASVSQQRPGGLHGGLLRLPAGRGGPCAHRGASHS